MTTQEGCKVERVTEKYGLDDADQRLLRLRDHEGAGLRRLETRLNIWILKYAMIQHGMTVLDGEEENYHRLLTDDSVLEGARRDARRELEEAGIDVDEVTDDFVSYQTIRKHLNKCLGEDTSRNYTPNPQNDRQNIEKLRKRVVNVVEKSINRLRNHDIIQMGTPHVRVSIKVKCGDCGRTHILRSLFESRECPCATDQSEPATECESTTTCH